MLSFLVYLFGLEVCKAHKMFLYTCDYATQEQAKTKLYTFFPLTVKHKQYVNTIQKLKLIENDLTNVLGKTKNLLARLDSVHDVCIFNGFKQSRSFEISRLKIEVDEDDIVKQHMSEE